MDEQNKWDKRFLQLAKHIASWSKDPSTQTGAVITDGKRLVSVGYNGFAAGVADLPERYNNRELKYEMVCHCETNAVILAGERVKGYTLYTWPFLSCSRCAALMIQAGIRRAVAPPIPEHLKERWEKPLALTRQMFNEADVEVVIKEID